MATKENKKTKLGTFDKKKQFLPFINHSISLIYKRTPKCLNKRGKTVKKLRE